MLKDAPIIILDEATANVDPENEAELQAAIEALTHNKTILMIAHRLKTVRNADQILWWTVGMSFSGADMPSFWNSPVSTPILSPDAKRRWAGNWNRTLSTRNNGRTDGSVLDCRPPVPGIRFRHAALSSQALQGRPLRETSPSGAKDAGDRQALSDHLRRIPLRAEDGATRHLDIRRASK